MRGLAIAALLLVVLAGLGGGAWTLIGSADGAMPLGVGAVAIATGNDGSLYVATKGTGEVLVYSSDDIANPLARLIGLRPTPTSRWAAGEPNAPPTELSALAVAPNGRILVADAGAGRLRAFASDGTLLAAWGRPGTESGSLDQPTAIAAGPDGRVYVLDAGGRRIQAFDATGALLASSGAPAKAPKEPVAIAVDAAGRLYALDAASNAVLRYDATGQLADSWRPTDDAAAQLSGLALAPDGRLWVADAGRRSVFALDDSGHPTESRAAPESASVALRQPNALALGSKGQVYILDRASGDLGVLTSRRIP